MVLANLVVLQLRRPVKNPVAQGAPNLTGLEQVESSTGETATSRLSRNGRWSRSSQDHGASAGSSGGCAGSSRGCAGSSGGRAGIRHGDGQRAPEGRKQAFESCG